MTIKVHCDSCEAIETIGKSGCRPADWRAVHLGLEDISYDLADLCPTCATRHWSSITKHRRVHEDAPMPAFDARRPTCSCGHRRGTHIYASAERRAQCTECSCAEYVDAAIATCSCGHRRGLHVHASAVHASSSARFARCLECSCAEYGDAEGIDVAVDVMG